jgi:Golgi phosphoprotein 3 (GPP34)
MPTEIPAGLPARAFLIGYDVERKRLTGGSQAELVQGAALIQLSLAGLLADDNGKAKAGGRRTADPMLDALLERITDSRPRPWKHWVTSDAKSTFRAVRDRLAAERVISVEERPVLGLIPRKIVTVRDTRIVRQLITEARSAVLGGTAIDRVDADQAALVAMVAAVELNTVFSGQERRAHRDKFRQLAERAGPVVKALRKAVEEQQAAG